MARVKRTTAEIDEVLNEVVEQVDTGQSRWPGLSYEEGIEAGIKWLLGGREDSPMEDE